MKRLPFWKTGQTTVKGILKKMPFLCRFSHKETCAPLILIPFSLVLKTQFPKQEQRIMYIISVQRTLCHYNAVTLPGDCHARYFCSFRYYRLKTDCVCNRFFGFVWFFNFVLSGLLFGIRVDMRLAFRFDVAHQEAQPERPCDNRDASNDCDD